MGTTDKDHLAQTWITFASSALNGFATDTGPEELEELVTDAAGVADDMLEEYRGRFLSGPKRGRRKPKEEDDEE